MSDYTGPITPNKAPGASNVTISGSLYVGLTLTGSYTYGDREYDREGNTYFKWYRADDPNGTNLTLVSYGIYATAYTLQTDDVGKYIAFEVTPVAQSGTSPGDPVMSNFVGPVNPNQAPEASNVTELSR